jgi:chromate transporter
MTDLLNLFLSFLKIGSFSFGGAYSLLPLIENEVVKNHQWITQDEFLKVLGMVEIIPGAISIKFATYTGYKVAGVPGIIIANFANLFTPALLILAVSAFYSHIEKNQYAVKAIEGIKFIIIGVILAVLFKYTKAQFTNWKDILFLSGGFLAALLFNINPIYIILVGGLISIFIF